MKGFSVQSRVKKQTISSNSGNNLKATNNSELKPKGLLIYNPTIICEAQAKEA